MSTSRRQFLQGAAALAAVPAWGGLQAQSSSPDQAKILVGFPAGGSTDAVARRLADGMRGAYARLVIVENKPGASGRLVVDETVRGPLDGSVMFVAPDVVLTKSPYTDPKTTNYKFDELIGVSGVGRLHHGFAVGPMVPESVRTMKQFIAWAKANPAQASFGTPGFGSVQDFLMQIAMKEHGFEVRHIPYKGSAPAVQDLLGGQVAAVFSPVGDSLPYLKNGRLRLLGTSGSARSRFTPDVPTFEEQGLHGMLQTDWFGVWMKQGTPPAVINSAHAAIRSTLSQPAAIEALERLGIEVDAAPPDAFNKSMRDLQKEWGERVRKTGYKPE